MTLKAWYLIVIIGRSRVRGSGARNPTLFSGRTDARRTEKSRPFPNCTKPLFQSVLTWYELLVLETDVCPKFHLFCWLPDSVHTIFSERFPAPVFTRTLRVPIAFPFMWYQNLIHCPLGSVAKNRSLYSLALSPGLLGEEASMNIYLPIPSPVNENALTIVSDTAHKQ